MPAEPTARERAEALAIQYAAEECLFAATDAIEAALTAAEQRGREAERERCAAHVIAFGLSADFLEEPLYRLATAIRALKEPAPKAAPTESGE